MHTTETTEIDEAHEVKQVVDSVTDLQLKPAVDAALSFGFRLLAWDSVSFLTSQILPDRSTRDSFRIKVFQGLLQRVAVLVDSGDEQPNARTLKDYVDGISDEIYGPSMKRVGDDPEVYKRFWSNRKFGSMSLAYAEKDGVPVVCIHPEYNHTFLTKNEARHCSELLDAVARRLEDIAA